MARPVKFDRETVLQAAIERFRDSGYCATRMPDLVKATQLQPGSLYAAFDSKQGLLHACLAQYAQTSIAKLEQRMALADTPLGAVKSVLRGVVEEAQKDKKGCLLVNTLLELAQSEQQTQTIIRKYLSRIEQLLRRQLLLAQRQGEIAAHKDIDGLTKFLMVSMWGFKVMAKTQADHKNIESALDCLFESL